MGLFEFVFGKSAPKDESASKQAFYLSDDDAKTFGNIDYMRSSKTVRRTFAKKKNQAEHLESIKSISALSSSAVDRNGYVQPQSAPVAPASSEASGSKRASRRKPNSDMDMFRNMAKNIGR